jgi:hypothetical protein
MVFQIFVQLNQGGGLPSINIVFVRKIEYGDKKDNCKFIPSTLLDLPLSDEKHSLLSSWMHNRNNREAKPFHIFAILIYLLQNLSRRFFEISKKVLFCPYE